MNELAVSIGVILFPGLIVSVICDKTAAHSAKWDAFKYGIYSFVFGVTCYALVQLLALGCWALLVWLLGAAYYGAQFPTLHVWSIATAAKPTILLGEIAFATICAPIVAALATWINNEKFLNRLFRWIGVSYKYGDENLFSHYLTLGEICWVYVRDPSSGQTYEGRISAYSETDHMQEIVLADVTVYNYETSEKLYELPSVYLSKPAGTFVIEAIPASQWEKSNAETPP